MSTEEDDMADEETVTKVLFDAIKANAKRANDEAESNLTSSGTFAESTRSLAEAANLLGLKVYE
jgi:hypothetical protein